MRVIVKLIRIILSVLYFILFSTTVFALTSSQDTILTDHITKVTHNTYLALNNSKSSSEEYYILIELNDISMAKTYDSTIRGYISDSKILTHDSKIYSGKVRVDNIIMECAP